MSRLVPLLRREVLSYLNSPIAYVVAVFFLAFTSIWFFFIQQFVAQNVASLRAYFTIMPIIFILLIPALTMRSWAEERKLGTAELLLTLPYREGEIVFGKFLGVLALLATVLVLTIPVPLSVSPLGDFETGQIVGQYIGVLLLGAAGIAIGLFLSAFSSNQITAFILTAVVLLFLTLLNQVTLLADLPPAVAAVVNYLSIGHHFRSFERGLVDTRDVVFYLGMTFLFLYLNTKVLVYRKWR
ncbi:MAG: ABC transporter permease subunit [Spirochaetaceae bacterium]